MTDPKEVSAIGQIFYEYGGRMAFLVVEDTREPNSSVRVYGMVPCSVPRWNEACFQPPNTPQGVPFSAQLHLG